MINADKVFDFFMRCYRISLHYRFQYLEGGHKCYLRYGSHTKVFYSAFGHINSIKHVHFSSDDRL